MPASTPAGRDGQPARADKRIQGYFLGGRYPRREESRQLYSTARELFAASRGKALAVRTLAEASGLGLRRTQVLAA